MLHHLHNMPVETSRDTIGQFLFEAICSKTYHADKAAKIVGMLLMCYHGVVTQVDEYVSVMSDIGAFRAKCDEAALTLMSHTSTPQGARTGTSSDTIGNTSGTENFQNESAIWVEQSLPETDPTPTLIETLSAPPTAHNIDMIVRALLASKAELNKSRLELETLRSTGVFTVTVNPPFSRGSS